jgi:UDP:flavonoid glycosyltransferase YjiC (YdhE family)
MGKVLFLNYPGEGHVNPTIALVEELLKKGEEVVYYCIEEYRNKIEKTGATFRPIIHDTLCGYSHRRCSRGHRS